MLLLQCEEVQFVDVREQWEYDTAKLPNFKLFPLSQASNWAQTIGDQLDPDTETIVLCHHGMRSMQMAGVSHKLYKRTCQSVGVGTAACDIPEFGHWCMHAFKQYSPMPVGNCETTGCLAKSGNECNDHAAAAATVTAGSGMPSAGLCKQCSIVCYRSASSCIICCCSSCRCFRVQFLVSKGFKTVKNVTGGIAAYSRVDRNVPEY
jgi:rhodanese-related sulfurtransferase